MSERLFPAVHRVPAAVAPLLVVGIAFGAEAGWLSNLIALACAGALLRRMEPGLASARARGLPGLGVAPGLAITGMGLVACVVLVTAIVVALGDVLVAYPAALGALPVLVLGALLRGKLRGPGLWGLALVLPLAGWMANDIEAEGEMARGYAHSGPIAGVHPFQMTSVAIDGYGPFDLSVNDFVEPDGSRGYGPGDLALTWERTLRALADIHFPDGPARARKAFGEATVEVGELPQLRDEQHNPISMGLRVTSGTHGERSRVEFVCPARVLDPRPRRPDNVMRDACPDKYAAEGSAGLGLTGRWAGYTEGRGNARLSLAHLLGATRTDDRAGERVLQLERTAWAAGLLVLVVALARRRQVGINVAQLAGSAALLGLVLALAATVAVVRTPLVPAVGPAGAIGWGVGSVLAAATGLAGVAWLGSRGDDAEAEAEDGSVWIAAAVGLFALGSAWSLASSESAVALATVAGPRGLVDVLADRTSLATGLDVQGLEGALAAVVVGVLAGAVFSVLEPVAQATLRLGLDVESRPRWVLVLVAVAALALAWLGVPGRVLVLVGVGAAAVLASTVSIASRRIAGSRTLPDLVAHALVGAGLVWTVWVTIASTGATPGSFFALAVVAVLVLASLGAALVSQRSLPGL